VVTVVCLVIQAYLVIVDIQVIVVCRATAELVD